MDAELEEGSRVTVLAPDGEERFDLDEAQEAKLRAALKEADTGDFVDADALLADLARK